MRSVNLFAAAWILTWAATSVEKTTCPPKENAYTGSVEVKEWVPCKQKVMRMMEKGFDSRADAEKFMRGCPKGVCREWDLRKVE